MYVRPTAATARRMPQRIVMEIKSRRQIGARALRISEVLSGETVAMRCTASVTGALLVGVVAPASVAVRVPAALVVLVQASPARAITAKRRATLVVVAEAYGKLIVIGVAPPAPITALSV